jgi:hypothetical protein
MVIGAMERLGLAWNVVRITPERQAQKAATRRSSVAAPEPSSSPSAG